MRNRNRPRVAIVTEVLDAFGGREKVIQHLLKEFPDAKLYAARSDKEFLKREFPGVKVHNSFIQYLPFEKYLRKEYLLLYPWAYRGFSFLGSDVVISVSDSFSKFISPWRKKTKHIGYILTPPRFFWLPNSRSIKDMKKFSYKFYNFFRSTILEKIWKYWDIKAARKIDFPISISEEVARRVKKFYDVESDVIYPPVEVKEMIFVSDLKKRENWLLYHGRIETYKGVELAIRACAKMHKPLKVSGIGPQLAEMKLLVDQLHAKGLVKFLGYSTDQEKIKLLSKCRALLFPVLNEDFGIVPVEALASGAPVIAHRSGGVLEVVTEENPKTGILFDDYTYESLAQAIAEFSSSDFNPANCQTQASSFASEIFRYKMRHLVEDVYKGNK